ncbi:MAG TPA: CHAT domain-containing protein, partial [Candidatus Cryosericum sp.]|nr:CHAT domain-containing protein [Candidatus Cryosericum sp.]
EDHWLLPHLRGRLAALEGDAGEARRRYQRAVAEVGSLRSSVRPALWRAALMEDRIAPYRALVRLLRDQGEIDAAWSVARAAKARTFVEGLALPGLESAPTASQQEGLEILPASVRLEPAWSRNERAAWGESWSDREASSEGSPTSAGRLRALLRDDERLIDFFVDGREVTAWRQAMTRLGSALFDPLAADLAGARHLIVVPGGALNGVPFAALEVQGERLVDRFRLTVLPAAEALLSRRRRAIGSGALVMGDPASGPSRLPAAAREAQAVGTIARGSSILTGAGATEAAFRALAPGKGWIHVAAHGRIDRIAPTRTHLALASGGGEDGRLEVGEVATMDLVASLVVLSGCGTGIDAGLARGDAPADERAGLPRAFLQAGAGTIVSSLWEMDDTAAAALMPRLYSRLRSLAPDAALADLQRDLAAGRVRDEDGVPLDHPYYWAGLLAWGAGFAPPSPAAD